MPQPDDLHAISACVSTYLDGLYDGDADKIASVFHPTSALTYEDQGAIQIIPRDDWLHAVRHRQSPRERDLPRHDLVLHIDQSGPGTALVKLKCAVPPRHFTDFLSLLKLDGRWQIVQKVYSIETREDAGANPTARPTTLKDDEVARITRWDFAPGANTGWHTHEWPYFVVMLTDALLELDDGQQRVTAPRHTGETYRRPAGVAHDVRNGSPHTVSFVEIEVKDPSGLV